MTFKLTALGFMAYLLYSNYAKDKGRYLNPKIIHALSMVIFVLLGAGSFKAVTSQFQHFSRFKEHYSAELGPLPAELNFAAAALGSIADLVLFLAVYQAAQRNRTAIAVFRYTLLASIPFGIINAYRGVLSTDLVASPNISLVLAAGTIVALKLGLFVLYGSHWMRPFLTSPAGVTTSEGNWKELA
jgi:hypothetical protein